MDASYNINGGFKPTLKRFADLDGPDFFPTPAWATYALIDNERFCGDIWECACGDGAMSRVLENAAREVVSSDLYDRGYGEIGHDFLKPIRTADNIVTNPPYNAAEGFVRSGVTHSRRNTPAQLGAWFCGRVRGAAQLVNRRDERSVPDLRPAEQRQPVHR